MPEVQIVSKSTLARCLEKHPPGLLRLLFLRSTGTTSSSGLPKASGCHKWKGMQESPYICPFLSQFPQAASTACAGDKAELGGLGLLTAPALMVLFEESGNQGLQKVTEKHTFILTHIIFWATHQRRNN